MIYKIFCSKYEDQETALNGTLKDYALDLVFRTQIREIEAKSKDIAIWRYIKLYQKDLDSIDWKTAHIIVI